VTDEGIIALQDDNGTEWQASGEQIDRNAQTIEEQRRMVNDMYRDLVLGEIHG
jgi:hypothetical protein